MVDGLLTAALGPSATRFSRERLALLGRCISSLNDIIVITDAGPFGKTGPRILFVNDAFERHTGYAPQEVIGLTPRILQGPKTDHAELRRIRAALERWQVVRTELINYAKDGREFHVEMDIVPVADDAGAYTHWIAVQRDVTARKRAEQQAQAREAQRTESLGTLAVGIAHDFNNFVGAILGNVSIARNDIATGKDGFASLAQIETAALRARGLVQQILDYGRRRPEAFARERLGGIVEESASLLRSTLPAGIELAVTLCDEPLDIQADAGQLQQVLLNLGTNAWHAIEVKGGTGRIEIDCSVVESGAAAVDSVAGPTPAPAGRCALLRVGDDGCGMSADTCARIFEPYFTTKAIGRGTGLGLSATSGILAAHGASISVESEPGRGTVFRLLFPLLEPPARLGAVPAPTGVEAGRAQGERVLMVDDDEIVLLMLSALLGRAGFRVMPFSDPRAALETLRRKATDFDIVVTDHNMPGLSGLQLVGELRQLAPSLPVVITSGYVDDALRTAAGAAGAAAVVGKEYAVEALGRQLQTLLARAGRA